MEVHPFWRRPSHPPDHITKVLHYRGEVYKTLLFGSRELTKYFIELLTIKNDHVATEEVLKVIKNYSPDEDLISWHLGRTFWLYVRDIMKQKQEKYSDKKPFIEISDKSYGLFYENGDFLLYIDSQTKFVYLLNYLQVMMTSDTLFSRYLSLLTVDIYNRLKWDFMPDREMLLKIYSWGDNILKQDGNISYKI